jgi:HlyD family secretion protein
MRTCLFITIALAITGALLFMGLQCVQARTRAKIETGDQAGKVERGEVSVVVIESGTIQAAQKVEVKSRVSGRLMRLAVREGDRVQRGDLIAVIDPQEIRFQVDQSMAQLRAAVSGQQRAGLSVQLSEKELRTQLVQAEQRFIQAEREWKNQPELSRSQTEQARLAYENAVRNQNTLRDITHPQERVRVESTLLTATTQFENDKRELDRKTALLQQGYVSQREVDAARSQLSASEAALMRAREEMRRLEDKQRAESLSAENAVREAKSALDAALTRSKLDLNKEQVYLEAKAAYEQAKANLARVDQERASYRQAAAQADQIRSALADTQRQLGETEIRAPMSGVVTKRFVEEGELVAALSSFSTGTSIVEIGDLSTLQVDLEVNEIDVAKLEEGMEAEIQVDALPDTKLTGAIKRIAPSSEVAAGTAMQAAVVKYKVEVQIDEADPRIKPGMSAKCSMKAVDKKDVLRIGIEYLGSDSEGRFVLIEKRDSKGKRIEPEKRRIQVGAMSVAYVEVLSGVEEGEAIVKPEYSGPPRQGMMGGGPGEG